VKPPHPIDRLDVAILAITAFLALVATAVNHVEATVFFGETQRFVLKTLPPWAQTIRQPVRRVESDVATIIAIASLGVGIAVLIRPSRIRTRRWPGPGVSAMAVATIAIIYMIVWDIYLRSQGHYWMGSHSVVYATVARVNFRTTGAIIGTWVVLAVSRRWRPRPDLLDRLGLFLGWSWIGLMAMRILAPSFWSP
jgi:hypothetical protein